MSLTPEQIEELRLAGSKWANQELRPKDPLNPGLATDPNARAPYPAESAWAWTLLPDQVDQVRDAINALLTGMINALEANELLDQALEGKEASGTAQSLVDALSDSVDQALEGKEASGTAQSLVDALSDSVDQALEGREASGVAQSLVDALSQAMAEALQDKEASGTAQDLVDSLSQVITEALEGKEDVGIAQDIFDSMGIGEISINKDITPVDIFIYDTKRDSDGGAWRKRCQGASWYQELGEFPSVVVVITDGATVRLYNADKPSIPEWMVFSASSVNMVRTGTNSLSAVGMRDGKLIVLDSNGYSGNCVDFVLDLESRGHSPRNSKYNGNISQRNDGLGSALGDRLIANSNCKDLAMTVLPNAPIDPTTKLPITTIALATDGGVSIINGPAGVGTVVSWVKSDALYVSHVSFRESDGALCAVFGGNSSTDRKYRHVLHNLPDSNISGSFKYALGESDEFYPMYFNPAYAGASIPLSSDINLLSNSFTGLVDAGSSQLSLIHPNPADPTKGMLAAITSTYNTGWMVGGTALCALCSTETSDLVGSGELVVNGDFATGDFTGFTTQVTGTGSSVDASTNAAVLVAVDASNNAIIRLTLTGREVGETLVLALDVSGNDGFVYSANIEEVSFNCPSGSNSLTITPTSSTVVLTFYVAGNSGTTTYDNISVRLADNDRSISQKGVVVNGIINREPVAAGADLVAYSGFTGTNYLEMPYSDSLDFGTGDFTIMMWIKDTTNASDYYLERRDKPRINAGFSIRGVGSEFVIRAGLTLTGSSGNRDDGNWHLVVGVRNSGSLSLYVDGNLEASGNSTTDLSDPDAVLVIGATSLVSGIAGSAKVALLRISPTPVTFAQISKIYNDEKKLFQEDAQSTLHGSSDSVLAIDHDDITGIVHACTADGRSDFDRLVRVGNTTDSTSVISAHNGLVVEA